MNDDTLVYYGDAVKSLGAGKVGGYLVRYGDAKSHDCQGDFFSPETDFGLDTATKARVVYHHGLGRIDDIAVKIGNRKIGVASLETKADGLWADAQLDMDSPEGREIYARVCANKLGWSSGSVDRLVQRETVGAGVTHIKSWPIIEASLSPRPVDGRNRAIAIKALMEPAGDVAPESVSPVSGSFADRADRAVSDLDALCAEAESIKAKHGEPLNAAKRERIAKAIERLEKLHDATAPRQETSQPSAVERLRRKLRIA